MKKVWIAVVIVGVVAGTLAAVGAVYAQAGTPPVAGSTGIGPGRMGGRGMVAGGFAPGQGTGLMHDEMVSAFAAKLNLSEDEINQRLANGETMSQIAQSQGLTVEEFRSLWLDVRADAIKQAVANGEITQEQADWMSQRMTQMQAGGYGPGACNGTGTPLGSGMMRGLRWGTQAQ